jgi:hypothetical protein
MPTLTAVNYTDLLKKRYDEMIPAFADATLPDKFEDLLTHQLGDILIEAGVQSIRQIYNTLQSCFFFFVMNQQETAKEEHYQFYLGLLTLKECWPDLLDDMQKNARKDTKYKMMSLIKKCVLDYDNKNQIEPLIKYMDGLSRQMQVEPKSQLLLEI